MKKILSSLVVFILTTCYLILNTTPVFAHAFGQPPYFKINGVYTDYYTVPTTSLFGFDLPQDTSVDNFVIGEVINFEIDTKALPLPPESLERAQFLWEYGDGQTAAGLKNSYAYSKPGTYFLDIKVDLGDGFEPEILQSTAINILPNKDYKLPKPVIEVNGKQTKDPLLDVLEVDFSKEFTFDASKSDPGSSEIIEYFWDLGDQNSKTGKTIKYTYPENPYTVFPLLRIKTRDGFIADAFVQIKTSGGISGEPPSENLFKDSKILIGAGIIISVILAVLGYLTVKNFRKSK